MKPVLISGNTGFIGSSLTDYFLSKKLQVIGLSNKKIQNKNIQHIKKNIMTITSDDIPSEISVIVHLAAETNVNICQNNPELCFKTNVLGTQKMLEVARQKKAKFVFISTSHVYGNLVHNPIDEDTRTIPTSIYSTSKIMAEKLCQSYSLNYGLDVSILRLFSVYGPNMPDHLVIHRIISQILSSKIVRLGNTFPKRDFVYIDDVVKAISLVLKKRKFNVYNVGSGKSCSINDVFQILKQISGKPAKIQKDTRMMRKNENPEVIADNTKIKKIGWKPTIDLPTGLKLTYDWHIFNTV